MGKPKTIKLPAGPDTSVRSGLVEELRKASSVSQPDMEGKMPGLRQDFGVPPARPGDRYGGWWLKKPYPRRVDFQRYKNEPKSVLFDMLSELTENAEPVAVTIRSLRATPWGIDEALALVIAWRESGRSAFGATSRKVDTWNSGGLDQFGTDVWTFRKGHYLPAEFPRKLEKTRLWGKESPEQPGSGKLVYPVYIPLKHVLTAYGATINYYWERFKKLATALDLETAGVTTDAKRVWTAAVVAGGYGKGSSAGMFLRVIKRKKKSLDAVTDAEFTKPYLWHDQWDDREKKGERWNPIKTGLVRAAEAKLLQQYVKVQTP